MHYSRLTVGWNYTDTGGVGNKHRWVGESMSIDCRYRNSYLFHDVTARVYYIVGSEMVN